LLEKESAKLCIKSGNYYKILVKTVLFTDLKLMKKYTQCVYTNVMVYKIRKLYRIEIAFIIAGLISLIFYFANNVFALLFLIISGTAFLLMFVPILVYKRKIGIYFGIVILSIVGVDQLLKSEILKDKILLSALLKDEKSSLKIILRENGKFEVLSSYMFGEDVFVGDYKLLENKIIFLDKHYDNGFIPDTVFIIQDKIILKFDKNGEPLTEYASFFQIETNELNYIP